MKQTNGWTRHSFPGGLVGMAQLLEWHLTQPCHLGIWYVLSTTLDLRWSSYLILGFHWHSNPCSYKNYKQKTMFSGNAAGMCHGMFFFSSLSKRQVKWMMGLCEYININYRLMHSCSYAILEHPNLRRGKTKYSQDDWKTKLCGHAVNFELFAKVKVFTGISNFS